MEQLPGQTLLQWLLEAKQSGRKATVDELVRLGTAMAVALFSLHRQRCCHHDLKPANLFLHRDGHVVLLDFGLARHAQLPDLHAEEPHFVSIAYSGLAHVRQEQLVKGVFYAFGVVNQVLVNGFLFVLLAVKNRGQFATGFLLSFPLQGVLKYLVLRVRRLLNDLFQGD
ncbi:MAG: hypothetical protein EBX30_13425 [Betaproteobacteria bacterium]|nr:hypothetical protein [Betaproteobacteria bacterium]